MKKLAYFKVHLALFLLGGLLWSCGGDPDVSENVGAPNIIFIMTDDQSPIPVLDKICDQSRPFGEFITK